jgi:hypothetical protein
MIPKLADKDPFDGTPRLAGQARPAERCLRIGQGPQRIRRAAKSHRRPVSRARLRRCAPLVVQGTTARNAPDERTRETGQMSLYQRVLV